MLDRAWENTLMVSTMICGPSERVGYITSVVFYRVVEADSLTESRVNCFN